MDKCNEATVIVDLVPNAITEQNWTYLPKYKNPEEHVICKHDTCKKFSTCGHANPHIDKESCFGFCEHGLARCWNVSAVGGGF